MALDNDQALIERDFIESWDRIEHFFKDLSSNYENWKWIASIHDFIALLRSRGYDRQLRAGHAVYLFVLSRSRYHDLRPEQAYLTFQLLREGGMHIRYHEDPAEAIELNVQRVELISEVDGLLLRLLEQPID